MPFEKPNVKCDPSGCSNRWCKPPGQLVWASNPPAGFFQAPAVVNFKEIAAPNDAHLAQSQQFCIAWVDFFPCCNHSFQNSQSWIFSRYFRRQGPAWLDFFASIVSQPTISHQWKSTRRSAANAKEFKVFFFFFLELPGNQLDTNTDIQQ